MTDNLKLWNAVCVTDVAHTKKVNQRGGFTAIDAHYQVMKATEQFGPVGKGWGWSYELLFPQNDTVVANVVLWHGNKDQTVCHAGQKNMSGKYGVDEDAVKKAITDGLTKCLSYLGFNADVFLGKFDDHKYVADLKNNQTTHTASTSKPTKTKAFPGEEWFDAALGKINGTTSMDELTNWWKDNTANVNACVDGLKTQLIAAKDAKKQELGG